MPRILILVLLAVVYGVCDPAAARACLAAGPACAVPLGEYRIARPAAPVGKPPALLFLHGAGGSAENILTRGDIVPEFTAHGYVVIAPAGLIRPEFNSRGWHFHPNRPHVRDELAFVRQVLTDATSRWGIDRTRVLLAGESIGGSVTWYLACKAPADFAAFAPIAGAFWKPLPEGCSGPAKLLHTHGWRDETVPLEGRRIRDIAEQGDVFASLAIWRRVNGCARQAPAEIEAGQTAWHRRWTGCAADAWLELALHGGGHEVPDFWAGMARAWFERVVPR